MTDAERKKLDETHAAVMRLNRVFFEVPAGGSDTLIVRLTRMVEILERGGWAGKWTLRGIMTIAGLGAAVITIKNWFIQ